MTARELSGREAALAHIDFLTGLPDTPVHLRLIHDDRSQRREKPTHKLYGPLNEHWPTIQAAQERGYGVFLVVNAGGNADAEITHIRALFVDADDIPLPKAWHVVPDFIVQRDSTHWHAYWRVFDMPIGQFRDAQLRLAGHYGTDKAVCNPSRVMRLAGTLHQKAKV